MPTPSERIVEIQQEMDACENRAKAAEKASKEERSRRDELKGMKDELVKNGATLELLSAGEKARIAAERSAQHAEAHSATLLERTKKANELITQLEEALKRIALKEEQLETLIQSKSEPTTPTEV